MWFYSQRFTVNFPCCIIACVVRPSSCILNRVWTYRDRICKSNEVKVEVRDKFIPKVLNEGSEVSKIKFFGLVPGEFHIKAFSNSTNYVLLPYVMTLKDSYNHISFTSLGIDKENAKEIQHIIKNVIKPTSIAFNECKIESEAFIEGITDLTIIKEITLKGNIITSIDMDHLSSKLTKKLKHLHLCYNFSSSSLGEKYLVSFPADSYKKFTKIESVTFITEKISERKMTWKLEQFNGNGLEIVKNILLFNPKKLKMTGDNMFDVFLEAQMQLPYPLKRLKDLELGSFWKNEVDCQKFEFFKKNFPNLKKLLFLSDGGVSQDQVQAGMPHLDYLKYLTFKHGVTLYRFHHKQKCWKTDDLIFNNYPMPLLGIKNQYFHGKVLKVTVCKNSKAKNSNAEAK